MIMIMMMMMMIIIISSSRQLGVGALPVLSGATPLRIKRERDAKKTGWTAPCLELKVASVSPDHSVATLGVPTHLLLTVCGAVCKLERCLFASASRVAMLAGTSHVPEGTKRATSANVQLPRLQKDLRTGSISREIANFPS